MYTVRISASSVDILDAREALNIHTSKYLDVENSELTFYQVIFSNKNHIPQSSNDVELENGREWDLDCEPSDGDVWSSITSVASRCHGPGMKCCLIKHRYSSFTNGWSRPRQ